MTTKRFVLGDTTAPPAGNLSVTKINDTAPGIGDDGRLSDNHTGRIVVYDGRSLAVRIVDLLNQSPVPKPTLTPDDVAKASGLLVEYRRIKRSIEGLLIAVAVEACAEGTRVVFAEDDPAKAARLVDALRACLETEAEAVADKLRDLGVDVNA